MDSRCDNIGMPYANEFREKEEKLTQRKEYGLSLFSNMLVSFGPIALLNRRIERFGVTRRWRVLRRRKRIKRRSEATKKPSGTEALTDDQLIRTTARRSKINNFR